MTERRKRMEQLFGEGEEKMRQECEAGEGDLCLFLGYWGKSESLTLCRKIFGYCGRRGGEGRGGTLRVSC